MKSAKLHITFDVNIILASRGSPEKTSKHFSNSWSSRSTLDEVFANQLSLFGKTLTEDLIKRLGLVMIILYSNHRS